MAKIIPFQAYRPTPALAARIAALPYDVMSADEARVLARDNPHSFLRVDKAEIDLPPETDPYAPAVYERAGAALKRLMADGALVQDDAPRLYLYRLTMDGRAQTGVVSCVPAADYESGAIKKHELTRADKEQDRVNHVTACSAHTGPIFLAYRADADIDAFVSRYTLENAPVYDFTAEDGIGHAVWVVGGEAVERLQSLFAPVSALYIADGHHRAAAACRVARENPQNAEAQAFLAVAFPDNQLRILDYNRVVKTLNGLDVEGFLAAVRERFTVTEQPGAVAPQTPGTFGMYLAGKWYQLETTDIPAGATARLDVSILQERLLAPALGIGDPRVDKNIDFIGGIRGLGELERRVDGGWAVAFALCPTGLADLFAVADANEIMPPKSTWFEPKLRSGLFIHQF